MIPAWQAEGRTIAWPFGESGHYQIPFVYSCNGRPFIKQLAEQSGTWFRDLRQSANLARPLHDFHSPAGLLDKLKRSQEEAQEKLRQEGFAYLKLRDYQLKAIQAVESAQEDNQQTCLLAMATGTGKTRTIIGLMYRLLKAERFKRILFLVDRNALGQQALDVFREAPLEQSQPLSKIYALHTWTPVQRKWLDRLAKQLSFEVVIDEAFINRTFANDGGSKVMNQRLNAKLNEVMETLADALWADVG